MHYSIDELRDGIKYTNMLSNIFNNRFLYEDFFKKVYHNVPNHHIEYLKSKLGNAMSFHNNTISGGCYIAEYNIPEDDRTKIMNFISKNNDTLKIKKATNFIKYIFCEISLMFLQELFKDDAKNEWNEYKKTNLDKYLLNLSDEKLEKYLNIFNNKLFLIY